MSPILDGDDETKLYTHAARLIPPLIDYFSNDDDDIRMNFLYLDPDCLPATLLEQANHHASTILPNMNPNKTYWGLIRGESQLADDGKRSFITNGTHSTITLTPITDAYSDSKNLITTASFVSIKLAASGACK